MPTYVYACKNCGHRFEKYQSFSDDSLTVCPQCDAEALRKVFNSVGIVFKGSGFYSTDSQSGSSSATKSADASSSEGSAASETSSDSSAGAASTAKGSGSDASSSTSSGASSAASGSKTPQPANSNA